MGPELGMDRRERRLEVLVVLGEVLHVPRGLVGPQAAPVLAQVDGIEGGSLAVPVLGELGLEEVVAPPVHVQHGARRAHGLLGRWVVTDQGRDDLALVVGRELEGELPVVRPEDVLLPAPALRPEARLPCCRAAAAGQGGRR
ncbi:hypothetical protein D3C74_303620 [compost metagenome]